MNANDVHVGQWVRMVTSDKVPVTGFVVRKNEEVARVAIPSIRKTRSLPYSLLHDYEGVKFTVEDIDSMIDVALSVRDFDWVKELSAMKEIMTQWE